MSAVESPSAFFPPPATTRCACFVRDPSWTRTFPGLPCDPMEWSPSLCFWGVCEDCMDVREDYPGFGRRMAFRVAFWLAEMKERENSAASVAVLPTSSNITTPPAQPHVAQPTQAPTAQPTPVAAPPPPITQPTPSPAPAPAPIATTLQAPTPPQAPVAPPVAAAAPPTTRPAPATPADAGLDAIMDLMSKVKCDDEKDGASSSTSSSSSSTTTATTERPKGVVKKVLIIVKDLDGNETKFRLLPTTPLKKLLEVYCTTVKKDINAVKFMLGNTRVLPTHTAEELEMEYGETIEVFWNTVQS